MNERTIFLEALEKDDPTERSVFLDTACAGDDGLRHRVEALLKSHAEAGSFLGKLAPERMAEELANQHANDEPQGETAETEKAGENLGFLAPADKPDVLGRLGHYDILEVIGRGGMGVVLRAFDEMLRRIVAVKVMPAQLATNATARKRFTREAQAQAAVSHDRIVSIHAVEETNGLPYLVMQYVNGFSLQQRLDRAGPLELHEILRIGMQAAAGLAAAHAQGLIHRDIKPANILLENGVERVKITDFGLARVAADASLTQSGVVAGTPQYMSPEQANGEAVDQRSDLFSLGSVLYAMCSGRAPFRAGSTMGVLRLVCEEMPSPIREINPEIPDWLIALIEKLHAKAPVDRYQTAAEVAELLSRHLAHVQHPSQVPVLPSPPARTVGGEGRRGHGHRWAVAAALLFVLVGGLSITEASGVTNLRSTVIRIFTPDGTLVVEVDDPGVKVTIEGDGGIVITGAGPQEVRLRPGSYKVRASKDGKPVRPEELVTITHGDRRVVRVSLEGEAATAKAVVKVAPGAFVILNGKGVEVGKFDTLAEAVAAASDGDTIEVRGNGPFVSEPIIISQPTLTIRSGAGFRPVIKLSAQAVEAKARLLEAQGSLVLEGLEFQRMAHSNVAFSPFPALLQSSNVLHVANCRFVTRGTHSAVLSDGTVCVVKNCELLCSDWDSFSVYMSPSTPVKSLVVDNCLATQSARIAFWTSDAKESLVQLSRNTWRAEIAPFWFLTWPHKVKLTDGVRLLRVDASGNVFDGGSVFCWHIDHSVTVSPDSMLPKLVGWKGEGNVFAGGGPLVVVLRQWEMPAAPVKDTQTLVQWRGFWGTAEAKSIRGVVRYQGGDLLGKVKHAPEQLTPEDFRLRPDSAGYRAGKDGKDLGADIDLVGPGKAYERWKKTPEYQQWLKETGQVK